jgi:hypothetical protein
MTIAQPEMSYKVKKNSKLVLSENFSLCQQDKVPSHTLGST